MNNIQQPVVRSPKQKRSKQRADQILQAARSIILQKGCAHLTISEIAEVAGITPGSMYQYYRNKNAIVLALGQYYIELFQQRLEQIFAVSVTHRNQLTELFLEVLEQHYQLYLEDPVVRDIWAGTATNKDIQDLDQQALAHHLESFCTMAMPLFPATALAELRRTLNLLLHFGETASLLALDKPPAEGRQIIDSTKKMLTAAWQQLCNSYPEANSPAEGG